jgi:hypothetical protein
MERQPRWFLAGLFATTLATLAIETLDTRLVSVLAWYHLSFFAVSLAMLGMAAGAVRVYLGGDRYRGEAAVEALERDSLRFALSIPLCYLLNISLPISNDLNTNGVISLALASLVLGIPFYLSGLVVGVSLTRIPGRVGAVYAVDLVGASLGGLLVLPLLNHGTMTSSVLTVAAIAALGAACFRRFSRGRWSKFPIFVGVVLIALAQRDTVSPNRVRMVYSKGSFHATDTIIREKWSIHGQVVAHIHVPTEPQYWSPGAGAPRNQITTSFMVIDGLAGTWMIGWDGKPESAQWTQYDLTALPYHLRKGGRDAVIGVGGGRDLLTAIASGATSVKGIEINGAFVEMLSGTERDFANLLNRPEVSLVHDEARSYLTRSTEQFDVLQMSLIDTWAATGAGAFTLSENGLYTVEAWEVFLSRLAPGGIFSVSRWYAPGNTSETSRLVSLATAALLRRGVSDPSKHLALVANGGVATLLAARDPLSAQDQTAIRDVANRLGFVVLVAPYIPAQGGLLQRIATSRSLKDIDATVRDEPYDFSPPTDDRPYFFNLLKPNNLRDLLEPVTTPGVVSGNLMATKTLLVLLLVLAVSVIGVIFAPLLRSGLPAMSVGRFMASVGYFSLIGCGFMFVQIGLMQRFSIYLGHPTYAVAVILFAMITATGLGSYLSDRIAATERLRWLTILPTSAAFMIAAATLIMQPIIRATIAQGLFVRCVLTVLVVAPVSFALGVFFPIGMRLVRKLTSDAEPWMWGVNGAFGVLASAIAVVVSMTLGIQMTLFFGAISYALLLIPCFIIGRAVIGGHGASSRASRSPVA